MKVELSTNNYLKLLRKSHCLTQDELAKKLGISQTYYSQVENGQRRPSIALWHKIHGFFNVPDFIMWQLIFCNSVQLDKSEKEILDQSKDKILKAKFENDDQRHQ